MSDATDASTADEKPKGGKKSLLFGVLGAVALGGAAFYLTYSGILDPGSLLGKKGGETENHAAAESGGHAASEGGAPILGDIAFVPIDPITISLPPGSSARHLRFVGQLQVTPDHMAGVTQLMPRIIDVLNTYLRAVEVSDLEQPASIPRLRAQMLRRVQVVTGEGQVSDLLITEFTLN